MYTFRALAAALICAFRFPLRPTMTSDSMRKNWTFWTESMLTEKALVHLPDALTNHECRGRLSQSFHGKEGFFDHNEPPCDEAGDICTGRDPFSD